MLNDFKNQIAKAKTIKQADKVLKQVIKEYGFLSNNYNIILNLCFEKFMGA
jgi:hypothetical protein